MTPSAIHQAIRFSKYPKEMEWISQASAVLPSDITDLLRLCASTKRIEEFAEQNHTDAAPLQKILLNFVDKVLLNEENSNKKLLGFNEKSDAEQYKHHYQLLIKIYHPDRNSSPLAADKTARITKAYQEMKNRKSETEYKNIRISRVPPKSFYNATTRAEQQISSIKAASLAIFSIAVISAVWIGGYLYEPATPELFSRNLDSKQIEESKQIEKPKSIIASSQSLTPVQEPSVNPFPVTNKTTVANTHLEPELFQNMLANMEVAYEKGIASKIQGILNTPEIKQQSDKEVFAKLENLFKITSDRKMLLYNFEWNNVSGQITGKGKFLSRYHLNGETQWLTREGIASILAIQKPDNSFSITSLKLDNNNIEQ